MPFSYLYQPYISSDKCDYIHNGTVLMYSHDHISNLGHTLNDIMNVWVMLWLENIARISKDINFLNIDSFSLGNNHYDKTNIFFTTYYQNFNDILKGIDFHKKTLCIQKLLIQPTPPKYFVWDGMIILIIILIVIIFLVVIITITIIVIFVCVCVLTYHHHHHHHYHHHCRHHHHYHHYIRLE